MKVGHQKFRKKNRRKYKKKTWEMPITDRITGSRNLFCNVVWPSVIVGQFLAIGLIPFVELLLAALLLSILGFIGPYARLTVN